MQPDPSLGIAVNFPQQQFENGIRFAMQMGMPVDPDKRPKFVMPATGSTTYWRNGVQVTPTPALDMDGKPLDPMVEVRPPQPTKISVDCAFEIERGGTPGEIPVGNFPLVRMVVTLLESDWMQVRGCEAVEYNGDRYIYDHEPENYGLFGAGIHTLIFVSEDES